MSDQGGAGSSGEAGSGNAGAAGEAGSTPTNLAVTFAERFVKKIRVRSDGALLVLLERALDLRVSASPDRELRLIDAQGTPIATVSASTDSRFLLDFAVHDSNDTSVLFSSETGYSLERFDAAGESVGQSALVDPGIDLDPPVSNGPPSSAIDALTFDGGRIEAFGEQVVLATRTGRHSVVANRLGFFDAGSGPGFHVEWRTLVVPPFGMAAIGLNGGSYDTFSAVQAQAMVHLAVDEAGTIYVAVQHPRTNEAALPKAHAKVFGEVLSGDADAQDLYVTRLSSNGARLGTTVVGTAEDDQLFGLRGGGDSALVIGRKEYWNEQGSGFDALVARLDGKTGSVDVRELDVKQSDLGFDAAALADGSWLVTGASHWLQNPNGASVSEQSQVFVRRLFGEGESAAIEVPVGPRHNEGRTLHRLSGGRWLLGGMVDGPGTHSGDAEPGLVRASGFLRELELTDN